MLKIKVILYFLLTVILSACNTQNTQEVEEKTMYFTGTDAQLEEAIMADNVSAIKDAIKQGANPNAIGLHGVTPIIITAGNLKFNAMKVLLESGSNPNAYDKNGDNAVTLAAQTYKDGDKRYLEFLLDNGGDVNSKLPDGDPLFKRIALNNDLEAIRWLINKGADINAISRTGYPLIFGYVLSIDWDTAWILMESGANFKFTNPRFTWSESFYNPQKTPPGSPLFEYKEKIWRKLCESGIEVPPLTTKEMWEKGFNPEDLPVPADQMPIITCDNKTHKAKGEWGNLKPKVESALEYLKRTGKF